MAGSSSPRPDDNDRLRLPAASSPRPRGAEKKESTDLRLSQPCPPYVTPSSISSFGRHLNGVDTAENKSLKNAGVNGFCQSSARCLVPSFDGAFLSHDSKDALWDRFYTAAPPRRRQSVEQYKIVKRA